MNQRVQVRLRSVIGIICVISRACAYFLDILIRGSGGQYTLCTVRRLYYQ